jgi:hypothetical protein
MKQAKVIGVIVIGLAIAGGFYVNRKSSEEPAMSQPAMPAAHAPTAPASRETTPVDNAASTPTPQTRSAVPADPRLDALQVSADNGLIEFMAGPDGRVIMELDKDPNSIGFRKPLREYTYSGDRVVGLVAYQYFSDHVQVTRTAVSYKPDGSVDEYRQTTEHDFAKQGR